MASNNRKMLFPCQPGQSYTFTYVIPFPQIYPPPPPPPPPPPERDLSVLISTSICILGSFLLFLFLTVFLYLYITKSRRSSPSAAAVAPVVSANRREDDENDGDLSRYHPVWRVATLGLQRSAIDSIAVVGFKKGEGIIDGTDCSVCLSEFEEDEMLRLLPKCRHAFHVDCIDMWLLSHKNCPLCRAPVFSTEEARNKKTETSHHQTESGTSNGEEEESLGSRNVNVLPRSQSDLARRCGGSGGRLETVRRSFSIGGSSLVKGAEGSSDDVAGRSRRQFYSSFSANFFSSSRRTTNQESVLPNRMPSASG